MSTAENIFSYIRSSIDILDVISGYVALKRAGKYYKGLSPFKSERTPSFTVSPEKRIFYCFSTHIGGDVIDFISRVERCNQLEAAKILIDKYKIHIPESIAHSNHQSNQSETAKDTYRKTCSFFAEWAQEQFWKNNDAITYLKNRGFSENTLRNFNVGYFPAGDRGLSLLIQNAQDAQILSSDLHEAGILVENSDKTERKKKSFYTPYDDRIIFPIADNMGHFVGFGGRIFRPGDNRVKYYNTSSTNEFLKKKILYGFNKARNALHSENSVFLVEGYLDVLALWQSGYKNVVATMGTACTEEHIHLLGHHVEKVIALYDGDIAGQNALIRIVKMFLVELIELEIVVFPQGEDPASLMQKKISFEDFIKNREKGINFFIKTVSKNFEQSSMKEKSEKIEELVEAVIQIKDKIKQAILIREIGTSLGISHDLIIQACKDKINKSRNDKAPEEIVKSSNLNNEEKEMHELCSRIIIVFLENDYDQAIEKEVLNLIDISGQIEHKKIITQYLKSDKKEKLNGDYLLFFDTLEESERNNILAPSLSYEDDKDALPILLNILRKKIWKKAVTQFRSALISTPCKNDVSKILVEFEALKIKLGEK